MKDDKITEVNSNSSENVRISSASNLHYELFITNSHQFRKHAHLVIPKERMNCCIVLVATPMLCCVSLFSLLPLQLSSFLELLGCFIMLNGI